MDWSLQHQSSMPTMHKAPSTDMRSSAITSASIKAKARELGFDICGVAPAGSFPELAFLREWLDRAYAGEMAYLSRSANRRADVRAVIPGARSVIVTGTLYNTVQPYSSDEARDDVALISRYAWGDDYHNVLKARAWTRSSNGSRRVARRV